MSSIKIQQDHVIRSFLTPPITSQDRTQDPPTVVYKTALVSDNKSIFANCNSTTATMAAASTAQPPLRIGTRRSNLAMVQAEGIRDSLQKIAPDRTFEIEALKTLGDKDKSTALYSFGAKNLWTTELEEKLTSGEIDVVVHCLKGISTIPFE